MSECAICGKMIMPDQVAAHRNGQPYIHLACAGHGGRVDERAKREDQRPVHGLQRRGQSFVSAFGVCRRVPPHPAAP